MPKSLACGIMLHYLIFYCNGKRLGRPPAKESAFSFEYKVKNEKGFNVCQKAFCALHCFSPKQLQTLQHKIEAAGEGNIELDKHGKHSNQQRIADNVCELIRELIHSFPARASHYSLKDNCGCTYLSAQLRCLGEA